MNIVGVRVRPISYGNRAFGAVICYGIGLAGLTLGGFLLPGALKQLVACMSEPRIGTRLLLAYSLLWVAFLWSWAAVEALRILCWLRSWRPDNPGPITVAPELGRPSMTEAGDWRSVDRLSLTLALASVPVLAGMGHCDLCAGDRSVYGTCFGDGLILVLGFGIVGVFRMGRIHAEYLK